MHYESGSRFLVVFLHLSGFIDKCMLGKFRSRDRSGIFLENCFLVEFAFYVHVEGIGCYCICTWSMVLRYFKDLRLVNAQGIFSYFHNFCHSFLARLLRWKSVLSNS